MVIQAQHADLSRAAYVMHGVTCADRRIPYAPTRLNMLAKEHQLEDEIRELVQNHHRVRHLWWWWGGVIG